MRSMALGDVEWKWGISYWEGKKSKRARAGGGVNNVIHSIE